MKRAIVHLFPVTKSFILATNIYYASSMCSPHFQLLTIKMRDKGINTKKRGSQAELSVPGAKNCFLFAKVVLHMRLAQPQWISFKGMILELSQSGKDAIDQSPG